MLGLSTVANKAVPADLLQSHDANRDCKWLCHFVMETRKTDGSKYPLSTLRSLVGGLNRVLQVVRYICMWFWCNEKW